MRICLIECIMYILINTCTLVIKIIKSKNEQSSKQRYEIASYLEDVSAMSSSFSHTHCFHCLCIIYLRDIVFFCICREILNSRLFCFNIYICIGMLHEGWFLSRRNVCNFASPKATSHQSYMCYIFISKHGIVMLISCIIRVWKRSHVISGQFISSLLPL